MASENSPEPTQPAQPAQAGPADDPLPEAIALAQGAADAGLGLKLLGGLAVRVLCPDFPPRLRIGQHRYFQIVNSKRRDSPDFHARRDARQPLLDAAIAP